MLSMPPAATSSASPARIACAASMAALRPEPQTLLTVYAAIESGRPAFSAVCRAGFWPRPAWITLPKIASSIWSGFTLARLIASLSAIAPSSGAESSARPPRNFPIGVRAAAKMKASGMDLLPLLAQRAAAVRAHIIMVCRSIPRTKCCSQPNR